MIYHKRNQQVKEANSNHLVHQFELFRTKEDEDIESVYSKFQTLVSRLQVLRKSYNVQDHVKKILRSLPARFRLIKCYNHSGRKGLNKMSFENMISSRKSHEIELVGDEPAKKSKSIPLTSIGK